MVAPKRLSEEKRKLTRRAIQKSAQKVFFEKGYSNATVAEIAKLAGIAKGSIYLYYQTKDDLYLSLMLPVMEEIRRSLQELKQKMDKGLIKTAQDFVDGFRNHYKRIYHFDPDGIRIIQAFQLGDMITAMSKDKQDELTVLARDNFQLSRLIFSQAMERKAIVEMDAVQVADIFWSTFIGVVQLEESKLRLTKRDHFDDTLQRALSILARGLTVK